MYTYSLVLVSEDVASAIRTTRNHLRAWDDEMGYVATVTDVLTLSPQRMLVKILTNQTDLYAQRSLNAWMAADRMAGPITGDLVWWCGGVES